MTLVTPYGISGRGRLLLGRCSWPELHESHHQRRQGYVTPSHHPIPLSLDPQEPTFPSDSPNQDTLGASDEAHQHQQADDDIKQQQAQVPQPPVDTQL